MSNCFIVNVYSEARDTVGYLVASLAAIYPEDDILLVYDGVPAMGFDGVMEARNQERFKKPENGGLWTHNYLAAGLQYSKATHFVKIDPDALAIKRAYDFPHDECLFGQYFENALGDKLFRFVKGGVLGFTRNMAERIVGESWMLDDEFKNKAQYGNYNDLMLSECIRVRDTPFVLRKDFSIGKPTDDNSTFWHK